MTQQSEERQGLSLPVILLSGIIASVLVVATLWYISFITSRWSPTLSNAEKMLRDGHYKEALNLADNLNNDLEKGGIADLIKGKTWLALAYRRQEAEKWKQYGTDPSDYFKSKEAQMALQHLEAACKKNPRNSETHFYLGTLYMEKGWFGAAETSFIDALRNDKKNVQAMINLSSLYVQMRRYGEAEKELLRAFKIEPQNPDISKNLSFLYRYYAKNPKAAMKWSNYYLNLETEKDVDRSLIRQDLEKMMKRYPEQVPSDEQDWREKDPKFIPRKKTPF